MIASTLYLAGRRLSDMSHELIDARRGMIDMRKRFRGNAPLSVSNNSDKQGQLYAGKPAFETVKEVRGDEVQMDPEKTRGL